jgi:hypothetical protein
MPDSLVWKDWGCLLRRPPFAATSLHGARHTLKLDRNEPYPSCNQFTVLRLFGELIRGSASFWKEADAAPSFCIQGEIMFIVIMMDKGGKK